jgi:hypothetical protein
VVAHHPSALRFFDRDAKIEETEEIAPLLHGRLA